MVALDGGSSGLPQRKRPRTLDHSKTRFNPEWTRRHPFIVKQANSPGKALCSKTETISHQGYRDVSTT